MIVSHKYKLLFVHIPKTGGGTIFQIIKDKDPQIEKIFSTHFPLNKETAEKYKDYFKFAVMRNPYTIQVSNYRWRLKGNNFPDHTPLKDFFLGKGDKNAAYSQARYIVDKPSGEVLVDWIGKYENLQGVLDKLTVQCNFPKTNIEHYERSHYIGDYSWHGFYDKETIQLVSEHCKKDFELGGYKYED